MGDVGESEGLDEGPDERPGHFGGNRDASGDGGRVLEPIGFVNSAYQENIGANFLDEHLPAENEKEREEGSYPQSFRYSDELKNYLAYLSARRHGVTQFMHPIRRATHGDLRRSLR